MCMKRGRERERAIHIKTFTGRGRERYVEEKLKTMRERDIEGLK